MLMDQGKLSFTGETAKSTRIRLLWEGNACIQELVTECLKGPKQSTEKEETLSKYLYILNYRTG